ncbi:NYN domain-containing protein [Nocardia sp. CA-107356]|uniref:NYN domain-containing protein n=1 Tax=Nocardia sp. CA-107356 TaxID=3239972 RepID=UPI003D8BF285
MRLAVLIDADNASPSVAEPLLAEIARCGTAHVKRAYGDWTSTNLTEWKSHLLTLSIQPVQQFRWTTGRNATDAVAHRRTRPPPHHRVARGRVGQQRLRLHHSGPTNPRIRVPRLRSRGN